MLLTNKLILILGGAGFLGQHLVASLADSGHRIRVVDRSLNPSDALTQSGQIEYLRGDFSSIELIRQAVKGVDVLYHLVSTSTPSTSNNDMALDLQSNVITTLMWLKECVGSGVKRVIFTSSGGTVYGIPSQVPIPEEHPTDPICSYGITKLAIEKYLQLYHRLYDLDYTILRCANAYGKGQVAKGEQGIIPMFFDCIQQGRPLTVWGTGDVVRDYIYVDDIVKAHIAAINTEGVNQIYNIGSGRGYSINELIQIMSAIIGCEVEVKYAPGRLVDIPVNVLDITRIERQLGWRPQTSLEQGLKLTWDSLQGV